MILILSSCTVSKPISFSHRKKQFFNSPACNLYIFFLSISTCLQQLLWEFLHSVQISYKSIRQESNRARIEPTRPQEKTSESRETRTMFQPSYPKLWQPTALEINLTITCFEILVEI